MKIRVVRIGNSKGIRIPKPILDQCAITDAIDLTVDGKCIVLMPATSKPRQGWLAAAERMRKAGDDAPFIPDEFEEDERILHEMLVA